MHPSSPVMQAHSRSGSFSDQRTGHPPHRPRLLGSSEFSSLIYRDEIEANEAEAARSLWHSPTHASHSPS